MCNVWLTTDITALSLTISLISTRRNNIYHNLSRKHIDRSLIKLRMERINVEGFSHRDGYTYRDWIREPSHNGSN